MCVQARVYLPEEPFPHAALVRAGRLKHARSLHDDAFSADFRQVSAGHYTPAEQHIRSCCRLCSIRIFNYALSRCDLINRSYFTTVKIVLQPLWIVFSWIRLGRSAEPLLKCEVSVVDCQLTVIRVLCVALRRVLRTPQPSLRRRRAPRGTVGLQPRACYYIHG